MKSYLPSFIILGIGLFGALLGLQSVKTRYDNTLSSAQRAKTSADEALRLLAAKRTELARISSEAEARNAFIKAWQDSGKLAPLPPDTLLADLTTLAIRDRNIVSSPTVIMVDNYTFSNRLFPVSKASLKVSGSFQSVMNFIGVAQATYPLLRFESLALNPNGDNLEAELTGYMPKTLSSTPAK